MKLESLPATIQAIIAQAGGLGLNGAFAYLGAQHFTYRCAEAVGQYRSARPSRLVSEAGHGFVDYEVGLQCRVNGKRGHRRIRILAYFPTLRTLLGDLLWGWSSVHRRDHHLRLGRNGVAVGCAARSPADGGEGERWRVDGLSRV